MSVWWTKRLLTFVKRPSTCHFCIRLNGGPHNWTKGYRAQLLSMNTLLCCVRKRAAAFKWPLEGVGSSQENSSTDCVECLSAVHLDPWQAFLLAQSSPLITICYRELQEKACPVRNDNTYLPIIVCTRNCRGWRIPR